MATQEVLAMEGLELKPQQAITPMQLLALAAQNGATIDVMERLVALQEKMLMREAEIDFNNSMHRIQTEIKRVIPTRVNTETHSKWASYTDLDKELRPIYMKEDISLSFSTDDCPVPDYARIVCFVSKGPYTRRYQVDICADGKGAKGGGVMSRTHATGSAMTYGMRYLLKFIFNVAIGEDDNDGNGNKTANIQDHLDWIASAKDKDELKKFYEGAKKAALDAKDTKSLQKIAEVKDKRKKELGLD